MGSTTAFEAASWVGEELAATRDLPAAEFMGVRFDRLSFPRVVEQVVAAAAATDRFRSVVTPNVDHMVRITARPEVAALYERAWLCVNDSRILQRLAFLSGIGLPVTPGADIVAELMTGPALPRSTHLMVVGGEAGLAGAVSERFGFARVSQHRPPMGLLADPAAFTATLEAVERSGAGLVILAVGSPQQEMLADALAARGRARGVGLCAGASLEFLLGTRRRAPRWMQRAGLEWAFRLGSEPGRLGRRYLVSGPRIFGAFLTHVVARSRTRVAEG